MVLTKNNQHQTLFGCETSENFTSRNAFHIKLPHSSTPQEELQGK